MQDKKAIIDELKTQFNNIASSVNASLVAYETAFEYNKPTNIRKSIRIISQTIREVKRMDKNLLAKLRTLRKLLRMDYNVKMFANRQKKMELYRKQSV